MKVSRLLSAALVMGLFLTLLAVDFSGGSFALADSGNTRYITGISSINP